MKNNKIPYFIWFLFNLILYALLTITNRSIQDTDSKTIIVGLAGNMYLYFFSISIYLYFFACLWDLLQEHIKLSNSIHNRTSNKGFLILLLDGLSGLIISQALLFSFAVPLFYWAIRIIFAIFGWLKYGELIQYTSCNAIPNICNFESSFVGINIIVNWFGQNDFGILVSVLSLILCFLFKKHPKSI